MMRPKEWNPLHTSRKIQWAANRKRSICRIDSQKLTLCHYFNFCHSFFLPWHRCVCVRVCITQIEFAARLRHPHSKSKFTFHKSLYELKLISSLCLSLSHSAAQRNVVAGVDADHAVWSQPLFFFFFFIIIIICLDFFPHRCCFQCSVTAHFSPTINRFWVKTVKCLIIVLHPVIPFILVHYIN